MNVLVTGAAGFIGFQVSKRLLERGDTVIGLDNFNDYYDPSLKRERWKQLESMDSGTLILAEGDLSSQDFVNKIFNEHSVHRVINLAAQAGVRYSLENPHSYVQSNVVGFVNLLEACRHNGVEHLTYASTSSVYGANEKMPFSEHDLADHPLQFYAATKRANELMAHSYSHLFNLPTTGLRFFTVYGPWGRPDMALFKFVKNILADEPIDVYNHGNHTRDFTFVDDIADGVVAASDKAPTPDPRWNGEQPDPSMGGGPFRVFNIGNSSPVKLIEYIDAIEEALGKKAKKNLLPLQPGDVMDTYADVTEFQNHVGYQPKVGVKEGVQAFVDWYLEYYK